MAHENETEHTILTTPEPPRQSLFAWLRGRFFAGVIIAAPIAISIGIAVWLITLIDARVKPLLPPLLKPETYTNIAIPGVGVLVAVALLTLLGAVATNLIGRSVLTWSDRLLSRIPVVSNIYTAAKQLFEILGSNSHASFKEVVMIQYPRVGSWCIGFVSSTAKGEISEKLDSNFVGVFVPTTPNPTSGFLMYVDPTELIRLDMTVEEGAKMIISAGLVVPEQMPVAAPANDQIEPPKKAAPMESAD